MVLAEENGIVRLLARASGYRFQIF